MIKSIYQAIPRPDHDQQTAQTRKEAIEELESTISEKGAFKYK